VRGPVDAAVRWCHGWSPISALHRASRGRRRAPSPPGELPL